MLPFKKNITILTAPGVGDIFWVYQKLSPHFNEINIIISILESPTGHPQDTRSLPFVKTLPKISYSKTKNFFPFHEIFSQFIFFTQKFTKN